MSPEEDRLLIAHYLQGDPIATRTLDGWIDVVLHESFRPLREDWDDLRQEIQSRILRNLTRGLFNGQSTLRTYVHRISKNVAIDFGRKAYRRREVSVDPSDPQLAAITVESSGLARHLARDLVERILRDLSEQERSLVHLVFELHYSYEEVARELGVPEGTVKSRMSRCKDRLLKMRRDLARRE
ncbi:MAG: RNA polymerase sigma factor [Acidobacteria bacterium]|nr:RNA polymerase sigma factor [Acidobacteriota bacterium]